MKNARVDLSGNPASSLGEAAYRQPVTVRWWRPHRGPLLKEREKGHTPSCFTSTIQETRVTLPALIGPTRPTDKAWGVRTAYFKGPGELKFEIEGPITNPKLVLLPKDCCSNA